jgi:hypothetical protein
MGNLLEMQRVYIGDNQQLIELVDQRQEELDFREAQICFVNFSAKWEAEKDYRVMRELDVAASRLIQLFRQGDWHFSSTREIVGQAWSAYRRHLLYHARAQS